MKRNLIILAFFLISTYFIAGCSSANFTSAKLPDAIPQNGFTLPMEYEMEFIIRVNNIKHFSADSLKKWNLEHGIPENEKPLLRIWCSDFVNMPNQRILSNEISGATPDDETIENENGNKIYFWDLSSRLSDSAEIIIKRRFKYVTYNYSPAFSENDIPSDYRQTPDSIYYFYTKSEPWLEQTPEIVKLANGITASCGTIPQKTKAVFNWVRKKMTYKYPPEKRGVLEVMKKYEGDCGQYAALFITLCRAAGIPARQQSGLVIENRKIGYHVWSEAYFPSTGWFPVDCTDSAGYGRLDNRRLTSSLGINIPLKFVPTWATYNDQDAQGNRTDFMQFMTVVKSGISASVNTEKKILGIKEIQ